MFWSGSIDSWSLRIIFTGVGSSLKPMKGVKKKVGLSRNKETRFALVHLPCAGSYRSTFEEVKIILMFIAIFVW